MKYLYFCSFNATDGLGAIMTGNAQVELDDEISSIKDIEYAQEKLKKILGHKIIVILNYQLMKAFW